MRKQQSAVPTARALTQIAFLTLVTVTAVRHQVVGGGPEGVASVDALCPFGGLEALYKFLANGVFINRLFFSDLVLLTGTIILALVVGRFFCGWICALGTLQEFSRKLGEKIFRNRRFVLPARIDKPMRYLKYVVLFGTLYFTWKTATLIIRPYDPWAAYAHSFAGWSAVWAEFSIGLTILVLSLLASVFYDRVFCKYLCPLGAFLGMVTKLSPFSIKRETTTCINCNLCEKKCPANLSIEHITHVRSAECLACMSCTTICPTGKPGTDQEGRTYLYPNIGGRNVSPALIGLLGIVLFGGVIGTAKLTGYWQTAPKTLTDVVASDGQLDPANIKGFMTLKQVSETFHVELNALYAELGLTETQVPGDTPCKAIRSVLGVSEAEFDTQKVRNAVARIQGRPAPAPASH